MSLLSSFKPSNHLIMKNKTLTTTGVFLLLATLLYMAYINTMSWRVVAGIVLVIFSVFAFLKLLFGSSDDNGDEITYLTYKESLKISDELEDLNDEVTTLNEQVKKMQSYLYEILDVLMMTKELSVEMETRLTNEIQLLLHRISGNINTKV
jgi:cell division protein FtsW (lipid II flippase)